MKRWKTAGFMTLTLLPVACSDDPTVTYSGNQISDYAATWDGYAEAFTFEDGSDRVRLTIHNDGQGTIEVGDSPLLPPPTDPNVGYPPTPWNWAPTGGYPIGTQLKPGFRYPLYNARVQTARIRLAADYHDVYHDWCAMQTPHLSSAVADPPIYQCVPDFGNINWHQSADGKTCTMTATTSGDGATEQPIPIDCVQAMVCLLPVPCSCDSAWLCQCDATSCWTPPPANDIYPIQIDGALESDGNKLTGTFATNDGYTRFTVRLVRQ
jgi:hypothetical protein